MQIKQLNILISKGHVEHIKSWRNPIQMLEDKGKIDDGGKYALLYQTSQFILKEYLFGQGTEKKIEMTFLQCIKQTSKTALNIKEQYVFLMKGQNSTKVLKQKYKTSRTNTEIIFKGKHNCNLYILRLKSD